MAAFRVRLLALVLTLLSTRAVFAKEDPDALIREGVQLRRSGRDSDALPKFERAYELSRAPRAAAQLGLCLQAMAQWAQADPRLAEALSATQDPWVKKNRAILKDALEQVKARVARLEILGDPVGAEVLVNGRPVGLLPLSKAVLVNEGSVDIEVMAPGFRRGTRSLTVSGASFQSVVVRLEEAPAVATAPPAVAAKSLPDATPSGLVGVHSDATVDQSRPITKSPWFWAGAVALVGAVALGVVFATRGSPENPTADQMFNF